MMLDVYRSSIHHTHHALAQQPPASMAPFVQPTCQIAEVHVDGVHVCGATAVQTLVTGAAVCRDHLLGGAR